MVKEEKYPSSMYHERNEKFTHRHPIIPSVNFYNVLKIMSLNNRSKIAVNCLNLEVAYQKLIDDAFMFSKAFKELGIKKGDIISISLTNVYHAIASFCAANRLGAVVTFLNPQSTIEQEIYYLNEFKSPLFIHLNKGNDYNENLRKKTNIQNIINLDSSDITKMDFYSSQNTGYRKDISFRELGFISEYQKGKKFSLGSGKDDALILFTSGTTGIPKSVVITNENILALLFAFRTGSLFVTIIDLAPALIASFLVMPVPNYHNMLTLISNIHAFYFVRRRKYYWKGWCANGKKR